MWVCVSNDFNVVNIVKSIIDAATDKECVSTSNLEVLQKRLHEILANKKFLLVLDDIWNEEAEKWDALKTLLFSVACTESVIIVTTRSKSIASIMGTLPRYDLMMLSEEDSWKLFQKRAFGDGEVSQQLAEIGKTIVDKCAGLPLALKVIGALLRTKRQVHEWHDILENTIWDDDASFKEILPALKLSYDQLAPYTKQCFAFCAMFPQDYKIQIEPLIRLWMANNLVPDNGTMDLEEKGWCIFYELYSRCFFQDISEDFSIYDTKITYCKMHDLIHDLAKDIAGKQCASMLNNGCEEVLHLAIFDNQLKNRESDLRKFTALRTCFLESFADELENENLSNSMKSTSFRALKINRIDQLPIELGYITHLRYLDLSSTKFDFLPETICKLYNLQTLDLHSSLVSKLPESLRCMISLRHLISYYCGNLTKMPVGIGRLRDLRTLTEYMVDRDPGLNIRELKILNNLYGHLVLSGLENVRDRNEAQEASMVSKTKLSSLVLQWGFRDNEEAARNDQEVLEGLKPWKLNYLYIEGYEGFDFPMWMKEVLVLRNATKLILKDCINCTTLPPLWQLPLIENLELKNMKRLVYICSTGTNEVEENKPLTFPNLKKLVMHHLDNLEGWHEKDHNLVAFPKLEELEIIRCPKLTGVPYTPSLRLFETHNNGIRLLDISNMIMAATSSELEITLPETATEPDAFRPPKNVEKMTLNRFENVIPLEEDDKKNCHEMSLLHLDIYRSNCFFLRGPSKLALGFWKHFASLKYLLIHRCNALSFWPEQEFRSLKCLNHLQIFGCENFTCSSGKEYEEDFLLRLEKLYIETCPKLVEIPKICSKSLKKLRLSECPSLSRERLNWLKNLHELKELSFRYCEGLKSLPDGLEGLTSLEILFIYVCPGIESFPKGLQQRLSQLQRLEIEGCPALKERCKSRGDYQHLVSAIPRKVVGAWDDFEEGCHIS